MGTIVGLVLLLPAYAIGGMGAGDVKLLAGVGAWVWATTTLYAFCVSAIVGGAIALVMVLWRRDWHHHTYQFWMIVNEIFEVRDPNALARTAAGAKTRCFCCLMGFRSRLAQLPILPGRGCCCDFSLPNGPKL